MACLVFMLYLYSRTFGLLKANKAAHESRDAMEKWSLLYFCFWEGAKTFLVISFFRCRQRWWHDESRRDFGEGYIHTTQPSTLINFFSFSFLYMKRLQTWYNQKIMNRTKILLHDGGANKRNFLLLFFRHHLHEWKRRRRESWEIPFFIHLPSHVEWVCRVREREVVDGNHGKYVANGIFLLMGFFSCCRSCVACCWQGTRAAVSEEKEEKFSKPIQAKLDERKTEERKGSFP